MSTINLNEEICNHQSCLESYALKFTGNIEDANDLVQDTIIKAIRNHNLYKRGTNFRGWLYTIMRNTYINDYRKKQRKKAHIITTDDLNSHQLFKNASKNCGVGKFVVDDIYKALAKIPTEYSVPFLKYFEGYKYYEIADDLKIPIGTVKTRIFNARQLLKDQLKMYSKEYYRKPLGV